MGALVAADGPHQHEYGREEALLQGLVLGSDSRARGWFGEWEHQRGGRAGGSLSRMAAGISDWGRIGPRMGGPM